MKRTYLPYDALIYSKIKVKKSVENDMHMKWMLLWCIVVYYLCKRHARSLAVLLVRLTMNTIPYIKVGGHTFRMFTRQSDVRKRFKDQQTALYSGRIFSSQRNWMRFGTEKANCAVVNGFQTDSSFSCMSPNVKNASTLNHCEIPPE